MLHTAQKTALLATTILTLSASSAFAAGFFLQEQSISGQGAAFAGETAAARDASTIFFNPAGMTDLDGAQIAGGVHIISPYSELTNKGSTATNSVVTLQTGTSNEHSQNPYKTSAIPNIFFATPFLDKKLWLGYGLTAPFGLGNDYGTTWFGRYDSTKTHLKTLNHSLSAAYKVSDWVSIGGGLDVQQADAKLNRVFLANIVGGAVLIDGTTSLKGDDMTVGWNAGVTIKPTNRMNVGLHYRSAITHELEGYVRNAVPAAGIATTTKGSAELSLPDIASVGVSYDINDRLRALFGATWYGWANFDEIRVKRPGQADDVTLQGYKNTYAFNVGAEYKYAPDWTFRTGFQYDPTPTVDEYRSSRTPDGDRMWLAVGATHKLSDNLKLDLAATQVFVSSEQINVLRAGSSAPLSSNVRADTEGRVSIFSVGLKYNF